jgi:hypothetical protein
MKQAIETPEQIWDDDLEKNNQRRPMLGDGWAPICGRDVAMDVVTD